MNSNISRRQQQVADLFCLGLRNKEIAQRMDIAEQTVKNHLMAVFQKTGADNRADYVLRIRGIGKPSSFAASA